MATKTSAFLLDTNVISEVAKEKPAPMVLDPFTGEESL